MLSPFRLPIVPLPLVLFPQTVQPLHIFEPRYHQLLADALAGTREFGILCRAPDVAEREIPRGTVGCVARVDSAQSLPDGRSNILVFGTSRFALSAFVDGAAPYLVAAVEPYEDMPDSDAEMEPLAQRLRALFARVGTSARSIQDDAAPLPELPEEGSALSFVIAGQIDLALADKQRLLATRSPLDRLRQLEAALAPIVESIEHRSHVHARARTNGHGARG